MPTFNRNLIDELNRALPAAAHVQLGTLLAAIQADIAALGAAEQLRSAPTLAIKAGSSPTVKSSTSFSAVAAGVAQTKAANTDMAALVGTLATAKSALWAFYIDQDGTLTTSSKTTDAATNAAALKLKPAVPSSKVEIGYILVANASGSNFVGGTTALDAAGITVTYVNNPAFSPASASAALSLV